MRRPFRRTSCCRRGIHAPSRSGAVGSKSRSFANFPEINAREACGTSGGSRHRSKAGRTRRASNVIGAPSGNFVAKAILSGIGRVIRYPPTTYPGAPPCLSGDIPRSFIALRNSSSDTIAAASAGAMTAASAFSPMSRHLQSAQRKLAVEYHARRVVLRLWPGACPTLCAFRTSSTVSRSRSRRSAPSGVLSQSRSIPAVSRSSCSTTMPGRGASTFSSLQICIIDWERDRNFPAHALLTWLWLMPRDVAISLCRNPS